MNASTVPKWIRAIAFLLDDLRQKFQDESKVINEEYLNEERVSAVSILTFTLFVILRNRELQDLFGLNSLKVIKPDYLGFTDIISNPPPKESSQEHHGIAEAKGTNASEDAVDVDECQDDDLPIFHNSYIPIGLRKTQTGDFLFRYLRTLVAWQQAVHVLFSAGGRLDILTSLKICLFTLTSCDKLNESSAIRDSAKRVFERRIVDAVKRQDALMWIKGKLENLQVEHLPAHVHAEAGLIALVYDLYEGPDSVDKSYYNGLMPGGSILTRLPIGVTKKCCALCYRLAELIHTELPFTHFELPGTHGIIYPWVPPPSRPETDS